jgi:hypothetical protein
MKTIIFTGIALITVALAFGISDYYKAKKNGDFAKLYHDVPDTLVIKSAPIVVPATVNSSVNIDRKEVADIKPLKRTNRRTIRLADFSRGRIRDVQIDAPLPVDDSINTIAEQPAKPEPKAVIKDSTRRISLNEFSRAPLGVRRTVVVKLIDTTVSLFPHHSENEFLKLK